MLKDIIKKNPRMMDIAAYMYNMVHRNNSWRYCLGRNKIKIRKKGAFLNRVKFEIKGINNTIVLGRKTRLNNCHIVLWGNNCVLEIGGGILSFRTHKFGYKMITVLMMWGKILRRKEVI